jgi:hypothetical protein
MSLRISEGTNMSDQATSPSIFMPRRRLQRLSQFRRDRPHWSHTTTYRRGSENPGLLVKMGRATLVDLDVADAIEDTFPAAVITTASLRPATKQPVKPAAQRRRTATPQPVKPATRRRYGNLAALVSASEI